MSYVIENHLAQQIAALRTESDKLKAQRDGLLVALRECKDVLFLLIDGNVAARQKMMQNAIACAQAAIAEAEKP